MIENGEITHPLKETMIGTTDFDLLQNISAVSKELLYESGNISPTIKISEVKVAGGK
jgi:predicted Zn-dependent protease